MGKDARAALSSAAGCVAAFFVVVSCAPAHTTCSADGKRVVDSAGKVVSTCATAEVCGTEPDGDAACAACDPLQCLPGNACITGWRRYDDAVQASTSTQTTECRLPCGSQSDCPFDYHCMAGGYCVNDRTAYAPTNAGEAAAGLPWGAPCSPQHAADATDPDAPLTNNADCDVAQGFWCYATSPTSGNGYCTQYDCTDDGDCPGGFWCATIDDSPDARSATRDDWGTTTTLCMPRAYGLEPGGYCAPCASNLDCPRNAGVRQHCVSADGAGGDEKTCATECAGDSECPLDDMCAASDDAPTNVCLPRAATCIGDGTFCSPCHSDADCTGGGYCIPADFSTEHFCTTATPTCTYTNNVFDDVCPVLPARVKATSTTESVACSYSTETPFPKKQCYGFDGFGAACYTFHCGGIGGPCSRDVDCCSHSCNGQQCN